MKQLIHPVSVATQYECGNCGTEIAVKSTQPAQAKLDTCSNCHPAYTGKVQSSVSGTRVDHFNDRYSLNR